MDINVDVDRSVFVVKYLVENIANSEICYPGKGETFVHFRILDDRGNDLTQVLGLPSFTLSEKDNPRCIPSKKAIFEVVEFSYINIDNRHKITNRVESATMNYLRGSISLTMDIGRTSWTEEGLALNSHRFYVGTISSSERAFKLESKANP